MLCDTEGECHHFAVGDPGFNAQLCGTSIQLLIQNFDLDQCVIQPNSSIIALTHHAELNAVAAGVALGLLVSECMDGLPVGKRVVAGMLCILQNVLVAFLQKIDMPALAVAELDLHTGTLLEVKVTCALLCKVLVILQIYTEGEISVGCIAEDLALTAQFIQHAIILRVQDPAGALCDLEEVIFQCQLCVEVLIQVNTPADRLVAFFFGLQHIVALGQILQLELAVGIDLQGLFALRSNVGYQNALEGITANVIQHDLAAQGLVSFGNSLSLGGDLHALSVTEHGYCYAAILIEGDILDHFLAIYDNRGQRIALLRNDRGNRSHTGEHIRISVDGIMLTLLQGNGDIANNTLAVKAEVLADIAEFSAILRTEEVPVSVQIGICSGQVIGSDVGRAYINEAVFHSCYIHFQPLQVIPGDKQFHAIAVAVFRVHFAALGGSTQHSHNIIGSCHILIAVFAVCLLEDHIAGGQQVDLKEAVILCAGHTGMGKIHFDTAIHIRSTVKIYIDRHGLCYIVYEVHTLLAEVAGHGDIDLIAAIFVVQVQPIVILVSFLIQDTVNYDACICFGLGFVGIYVGILFFGRHFIHFYIFLHTACQHQSKQRQHKKYNSQGSCLQYFHNEPSLLTKNSDFGNADSVLSFRHFHSDLHRFYIQFFKFCIGGSAGSDIVNAAVIVICFIVFRAERHILDKADNFLALFLADEFHSGDFVKCGKFLLGIVDHHRTDLPCLLKVKGEGGRFRNRGLFHIFHKVGVAVFIDGKEAVVKVLRILAAADGCFFCNVSVFSIAFKLGLYGAGRTVHIHNIQVVAELILDGDPLHLVHSSIPGATGNNEIIMTVIDHIHFLAYGNKTVVTCAGDLLAACHAARHQHATFRIRQFAVRAADVICHSLCYLIGAVAVATHREGQIILAIACHHEGTFVDADFCQLIGYTLHILTVPGCLPVFHGIEGVVGQNSSGRPIRL